MYWVLGFALAIVIGYLLDREIYFYEGVHLGPRAQAWLYDRWAKRYDEGKRESQRHDQEMLVIPVLELLNASRVPEPFILDFATGTGRLSYAFLRQAELNGHIIALDLSQGMLEQAAAKLTQKDLTVPRRTSRVELLRHPSLPLPFADGAFDVVCALEVLELFPKMDEPLQELTRVLRPGGVLLTSRGTEESGRRAKVKNASIFTTILQNYGLREIYITKWWKLFDRVTARKIGNSQPTGPKALSDVLQCTTCGNTAWEIEPDSWTCRSCGRKLPVTKEGIIKRESS
jgi:ubiquinone/menaquinone biosynthesis C-methylase UbiE